MPAFGGEDLSTLFVTSTNWRLSAEEYQAHPLEGALLMVEAPVPGLPPTSFATN
jgi:sugar lactone lactonase YvrE